MVAHFFELLVELLNNLLPFPHDPQIARMHVVLMEQVFAWKMLYLQSFDLFDGLKIFQLELRNQMLKLRNFTRRLFRFQLND